MCVDLPRHKPTPARAALSLQLGGRRNLYQISFQEPWFLNRPYTLGFSFLLRGKPWEWLYDGVRLADVERAYAQVPYSTREILHPEQYWDRAHRDSARPLTMSDLSGVLGPGWKQAVAGSIGELGLTVITGSTVRIQGFEALLPTRWITAGASGNEGDVYHHYVSGERKVTVFLTTGR